MTIFAFVAFLPLFCFHADYSKELFARNPEFLALFHDDYRQWLFVSVLVAVPMMIELILDFKRQNTATVSRHNSLSRVLLLVALVVPNITLFLILRTIKSQDNHHYLQSYIPQIQLSLFATQQIVIIGSMFATRFDHTNTAEVQNLQFSVGEYTAYFLFTFIIGKLFLFFATITKSYFQVYFVIGCGIVLFAVVQLLWLIARILRHLGHQMLPNYKFRSHDQMSDFYHAVGILMFVIADIFVFGVSERSLDINPHHVDRLKYQFFLAEFLYVQVALTFFLTAIPSRCYILSAELKQEKLETRLNLIRYVSHEMRTPLNTAFLGLGILRDELKSLDIRMKTLEEAELADLEPKSNVDVTKVYIEL
jgi:signal transduction histidine kinase